MIKLFLLLLRHFPYSQWQLRPPLPTIRACSLVSVLWLSPAGLPDTVQPFVTAQPAVVAAQPSGAQAYSTNYSPSDTTAAPAAGSYSSNLSTNGKWYPFYGYRRPAYLR